MNIQKKMLNTAEFLGLCVHVNVQRVQGDPINEVYYVNGIQTGVVLKDMQIKFGIGNNTELARVIDITKIELTNTPCIAAPNVVNAILYGYTTNAITEVMVRIFKQEIHAIIERDFKKRYPNCTVHIAYKVGPAKFTVCPQLDTYYCVELETIETNEEGAEVYGSQTVYKWKENGKVKLGFRSELTAYFRAQDMLISDALYAAFMWNQFKMSPGMHDQIGTILAAELKVYGTPLLRSLTAEFGDGVCKNLLISQVSYAELHHPVQFERACEIQPLALPSVQAPDFVDIDMDTDITFVTEDIPVIIEPIRIDNDAEITIVPIERIPVETAPTSTPPPLPAHVEIRKVSATTSRITVTVGDDYPPVPNN